MKRLVGMAIAIVAASACSQSAPTTPPPPISGGTLLITRDGRAAIAAEPERDRITVVDLAAFSVRSVIPLKAGDEPGRVAEDAAGRIWVALRRGGAVAVIDPVAGQVVSRIPVCAAPRGLAFEAATGRVHVACSGGDLVSISSDGKVVRRVTLRPDLRDVVVDGAGLLVSRFRSAEILSVDAEGRLARTSTPPSLSFIAPLRPDTGIAEGMVRFEPNVAWRMVGFPGGGAAVVHQRSQATAVSTEPGGYSTGECRAGVVHGTVSILRPSTELGAAPIIPMLVVPVDVAVSPDGQYVATVGAGNSAAGLPEVVVTSTSALVSGPTPPPPTDGGTPDGGTPPGPIPPPPCGEFTGLVSLRGEHEAVAVAFAGDRLLVQTREPALAVVPLFQGHQNGPVEWVRMGAAAPTDTGHQIFHGSAMAMVACASCHPEGGDDGRVWQFVPDGPRRTQALHGGLLNTAPFHWSGDLPNLEALLQEVLMQRMGGLAGVGIIGPEGAPPPSGVPGQRGFAITPEQVTALGRWLNALPAALPPATTDPSAVERGRILFNSDAVGCGTCHAGAMLTNNATVDVGTGGAFQVPSLLGLRARGPYLHNGCAKTLRERFGPCGGGDRHGITSQLSEREIADLVAYLESL